MDLLVRIIARVLYWVVAPFVVARLQVRRLKREWKGTKEIRVFHTGDPEVILKRNGYEVHWDVVTQNGPLVRYREVYLSETGVPGDWYYESGLGRVENAIGEDLTTAVKRHLTRQNLLGSLCKFQMDMGLSANQATASLEASWGPLHRPAVRLDRHTPRRVPPSGPPPQTRLD